MHVLKAEDHLREVEASQFDAQAPCEVVDDLHQVTSWHQLHEHEDESFVLRKGLEVQHKGVVQLGNTLDFAQNVLLLFVLQDLAFAHNLHSVHLLVAGRAIGA